MNWLRKLLGQDKHVPTSSATLQRGPGGVYELRIGGVLNKATVDRIQAIAKQDIERGTKGLKLLVLLKDFTGWRKGDSWGDIDFFASYGDEISRIAAVGETTWKEGIMAFLLAGRRKGEVRYFTPDQEAQARAWLVS